MAAEYQQYQSSPEAQQANMVNMAANRLDTYVAMGHKSFVDGPKFFKDVYLLRQAGFFGIHPEKVGDVQRLASYPNVRTEFFNTLRAQDGAGESDEVLASVAVGEVFEYNLDRGNNHFRVLFDALKDKHSQLIKDAENKKKAEEAAAAEARRKAKLEWSPELLVVNTGKSQEWMDTQASVAVRWEQIRKTLPQGVDRETPEAAVAYFRAGFSLLGEYMLGAGSPSTDNGLYYRAALEYLIPQTWLQPKLVKSKLDKWVKGEDLDAADIGNRRPTNLKGLNVVPRTLFITPSLQGLTVKPSVDQKRQIDTLHRAYQFALHPDISNRPDVNPALTPHIETIHKVVNNGWKQVGPLIR